MAIPKRILRFRRKAKAGTIMKPATFRRIMGSAAAAGMRNPEAVAGAAYWRTAKAKFRRRKKS